MRGSGYRFTTTRPLCSYLFIICVEGLSTLFIHAKAKGVIHGVKISRNAHTISHLLFADDSFLFFRVSPNEAFKMKNILSTYEATSGQAINLHKSVIFCDENVSQGDHNNISSILSV